MDGGKDKHIVLAGFALFQKSLWVKKIILWLQNQADVNK